MRPSFLALKKYDITQRVFNALTDAQSRTILFSLIKKEKSAEELVFELRMPMSSIYKKINGLLELSLVEISSVIKSTMGKEINLYKSRISKAEITITKIEPEIRIYPN